MGKEFSFDSKCYDLALHFFPNTGEETRNQIAQAIQECVEDICLERCQCGIDYMPEGWVEERDGMCGTCSAAYWRGHDQKSAERKESLLHGRPTRWYRSV